MIPSPVLAIAFPSIDPVAISLGPIQIHWYGIAYVIGILFGWWWAKRLVTNSGLWGEKGSPIAPDDLDDFMMWAVIGIIVGGRLGYVLFYDLAVYLANPLQIGAIWTGGMSFHGGLLGTIVAMILFARKRGFSAFSLFDVIGASVGIGIFLGRVANFINGELFGKATDLPWGIAFPQGGGMPRHPSQLYEGILEGLMLFGVLFILTHLFKKLGRPGFVAGAFICWYAVSRIIVEFVRLPDEHIGYLAGGWLTIGMVLSVPMFLVGIWSISTSRKRIS